MRPPTTTKYIIILSLLLFITNNFNLSIHCYYCATLVFQFSDTGSVFDFIWNTYFMLNSKNEPLTSICLSFGTKVIRRIFHAQIFQLLVRVKGQSSVWYHRYYIWQISSVQCTKATFLKHSITSCMLIRHEELYMKIRVRVFLYKDAIVNHKQCDAT